MKICAWCEIKLDSEMGEISHGICEACAGNFLAQIALPMPDSDFDQALEELESQSNLEFLAEAVTKRYEENPRERNTMSKKMLATVVQEKKVREKKVREKKVVWSGEADCIMPEGFDFAVYKPISSRRFASRKHALLHRAEFFEFRAALLRAKAELLASRGDRKGKRLAEKAAALQEKLKNLQAEMASSNSTIFE